MPNAPADEAKMTTKPTYEALENKLETLDSSNARLSRELKSLADENLKYRLFFDLAIDSIFILEDYKFVECNQMTLTMFGCDNASEILGTHPWDYSPPHQPDGRPSKEKAIERIDAALSGIPQKFIWTQCKRSKNVTSIVFFV